MIRSSNAAAGPDAASAVCTSTGLPADKASIGTLPPSADAGNTTESAWATIRAASARAPACPMAFVLMGTATAGYR
jgi:hypothetical protein